MEEYDTLAIQIIQLLEEKLLSPVLQAQDV